MSNVTNRIVNLEQQVHRLGWDRPHSLYFLYQAGDFLVPFEFDSPQRLALVARMFHEDRHKLRVWALLNQVVARKPLAVAFSSECWFNDQPSDEQGRRRDNRHLADVPGSREARSVAALAMDRTQFMLMRPRGDKPQVEVFPPGSPGRVGGRVFDSLELIVSAVLDVAGAGSRAD